MGILSDDIALVRESTNLVDLVSSYLSLRRVGRRHVGLCPFHSENTPSFSVNEELGFYYCFGCGASGDAITFIRDKEHLDFVGAVERLASFSNISLRYTNKFSDGNRKKRNDLLEVIAKAQDWYHKRLLSSPDAGAARAYLRERNIDGDLARRYKLGWAPDEWDTLYRSLGVNQKQFIEAGLGFMNKANRVQDHFRARLLFPIHDARGDTVGFGGRILAGASGPKYKNSFDSLVYSKSKLLYGLHLAKEEIVQKDETIICEGYTDVIGFYRCGIRRAVATCGTALTEEHLKILKRYSKRVVLAFDADAAGQSAAERIYEWEANLGLEVAVAHLPQGSDPADLADKDPQLLVEAIQNAQPFLGFRLERVLEGQRFDTPEARVRAARAAVIVAKEHPDELVRDQYMMLIASRCSLNRNQVKEIAANTSAVGRSSQRRQNSPQRSSRSHADLHPNQGGATALPRGLETQMVLLQLHDPSQVGDYINASLFQNQVLADVFQMISLTPPNELADAVETLDQQTQKALSQLLVLEPAEGETAALNGQFLYEAAKRIYDELFTEATREHDSQLLVALEEMRTQLESVRQASFGIDKAQSLLQYLPQGSRRSDSQQKSEQD